jgi:anti-sigma regulatory factor (Ser/Thr protein kinase)
MDGRALGSERAMRGRVDTEAEVTGLGSGDLRHVAFFYRDQASYRTEILRFVRTGLELGEPALVALPGEEAGRIAGQLAAEPGELLCMDMTDLGRNPARIIPALRAFVDKHVGQPVRLVEEPVWPGRSAAEACEAIRGDALINLALAGTRASLLCPFDVASLPARVIAGAQQTHPEYLTGGRDAAGSGQARVPWQIPPGYDDPLPPPPASAESIAYYGDLARVRRLVERHARSSRLGPLRASDLVLSVSEVAANTLDHTAGAGTLHVWEDDEEVLCQTHDTGWITDPLAGRVRTGPESRGHGLFVVNQVCDLVELRTGQAGTTIRLHMHRDLV